MNIQLFLNDSAESKIAQLEQLLAEDARKGKVYKWIKVNNNPVPLDKYGNPLSSVGKKIFSGAENKIGKSSRASTKSGKEQNNAHFVATKVFKLNNGRLTGDKAHSYVAKPIGDDERVAVGRYSQDTHRGENIHINGALRDGEEIPWKYKETYEAIERMFDRAEPTKEPIRVYRGLPVKVGKSTLKDGGYFDRAYTSTSTDVFRAVEYAETPKHVLVIDVPAGSKAVSIHGSSLFPEDKEILFPRRSEFVVKSSVTKNGIIYIHVEVADEQTEKN